jgi:hypothetical protein
VPPSKMPFVGPTWLRSVCFLAALDRPMALNGSCVPATRCKTNARAKGGVGVRVIQYMASCRALPLDARSSRTKRAEASKDFEKSDWHPMPLAARRLSNGGLTIMIVWGKYLADLWQQPLYRNTAAIGTREHERELLPLGSHGLDRLPFG